MFNVAEFGKVGQGDRRLTQLGGPLHHGPGLHGSVQQREIGMIVQMNKGTFHAGP